MTTSSPDPKPAQRLQILKALDHLITIHGDLCGKKPNVSALKPLIEIISHKLELLHEHASGSLSFAEIRGNLEKISDMKAGVQQQSYYYYQNVYQGSFSFELSPILLAALDAQVDLMYQNRLLKVDSSEFLVHMEILARVQRITASEKLGAFLASGFGQHLRFLSRGGDAKADGWLLKGTGA